MTKDDVKAAVLEALAEHDLAKRKAAKVAPGLAPLYEVWKESFGPVAYSRFARALKPVSTMYREDWIAAGIRAYAADAARSGKPQFYSPEKFAGLAVHFILPLLPSNELTEKEARFLGPEMVASRNHADTLGLLTDRARG